jgi:hypothetical protein
MGRFPAKFLIGALIAFGLGGPLGAVGAMIPWALNGGATQSADQVLLCDNSSNEARTAYNPCLVNLGSDFDLSFSVYFGQNAEQCGGDGMAFILQNCGTTALGTDSGEHAYTGSCGSSLAIDFDTFQNVAAPYNDPVYNSLELRTGGSQINESTCGAGLVSGPCRPPISTVNQIVTDGLYHTVEIQWTASIQTLSVRVDSSPNLSAAWVLPPSYVTSIFGGDANVYYGWGASSGGTLNYEAFAQTSANPSLGCAPTPTLVATPSPINAPTSACGNTPAPTFTPPGATNTPTKTPTPYPTACGALPALVQSQLLNQGFGCAGSGNPVSWSYTVPSNPGQVLVANVEAVGPTLSGVTYGGFAMTPAPGSPAPIPGGGSIYTYYLANPPAGTFTLAFSVTTGCSWNAVASLYKNVDTANPIGATHANSGNAATFTDAITTTGGYSMVHDFIAYSSGPFTFSGMNGTQLFDPSISNCCDDAFGSYYNTSAPGAYNVTYTEPSGPENWASEALELMAAPSCGTPSPAASLSPTGTASATPAATAALTATPSASPGGLPGPVPWVLNGTAMLGLPGQVFLTNYVANQAGSMWNPCALDLTQNFDLSFGVNFGVNTCSGDGVAFVLQNQGTSALGADASDHGYTGISNSVAVAFDTYTNPSAPYDDPAYDSLDLMESGGQAYAGPSACGGTGWASGTCARPAISATQANMKDGLNHAVEIQWNASAFTLTVLVDGGVRAAWILPSNVVSQIFGGNGQVYYGFTGSTGGTYNRQAVAQTSANGNACGYTATPTFAAVNTPLPAVTNMCPPTTNTPSFTASPSPTPSLTGTPAAGSPTASPSQTPAYSATPTSSASPTRSPTPQTTLLPKADPPPGTIFSYPQPCRGQLLHFAYYMRRPGQANLRVFNAAGLALGGLNEHRQAGPEVGTLQVGGFANGVYYYLMEVRYDAGDREMFKAGKFLILRP